MAEIKDKKKFHIFSAAYIGSTVKTGERFLAVEAMGDNGGGHPTPGR